MTAAITAAVSVNGVRLRLRALGDPAPSAPTPQMPAAALSAAALSVRSQVNSGSVRPKWPNAAVFL